MPSPTASPRWLAVLLSPDAVIRSVSPGSERCIGYLPQDLVGQPVTRMLADDSAFELPQVLDQARKWGCWEGGLMLLSRVGMPLEARASLLRLTGGENQDAAFLLISNLDASQDSCLEPDSSLTEISARLRRFAHDLNNPLAVMLGFAQLLALNASCPPKIRADVERICSELKQTADMVEKLRNYALWLEKEARAGRTRADRANGGVPQISPASPGGPSLPDS